MPSVHPLTKDALVVTVGAAARDRLSLRRDALALLLDPPSGVKPRRVPLLRGRDQEAGDVTLSRTGRTLQFRVIEPPRLLLAAAANARRLLRGETEALALVDATDDATGEPPDDEAQARRRREQAERLRDLVARRAARPSAPDTPEE